MTPAGRRVPRGIRGGASREWARLRAYALAKPGAVEEEPWDDVVVCKLAGKIFVFLGSPVARPASITVSCGPQAAEWRARFPEAITVAPYVGRYGWNAVRLDGAVPFDELAELVDHSYDRVAAKLARSKQPPPG